MLRVADVDTLPQLEMQVGHEHIIMIGVGILLTDHTVGILSGCTSDLLDGYTNMLIKSVCKKCINKHRKAYGEDRNDPETQSYPWCERDERGWRISRLVLCAYENYLDSLSAFDKPPESCPYQFVMLVAQGMSENDEQEESE